jgi:hypothetical protein
VPQSCPRRSPPLRPARVAGAGAPAVKSRALLARKPTRARTMFRRAEAGRLKIVCSLIPSRLREPRTFLDVNSPGKRLAKPGGQRPLGSSTKRIHHCLNGVRTWARACLKASWMVGFATRWPGRGKSQSRWSRHCGGGYRNRPGLGAPPDARRNRCPGSASWRSPWAAGHEIALGIRWRVSSSRPEDFAVTLICR